MNIAWWDLKVKSIERLKKKLKESWDSVQGLHLGGKETWLWNEVSVCSNSPRWLSELFLVPWGYSRVLTMLGTWEGALNNTWKLPKLEAQPTQNCKIPSLSFVNSIILVASSILSCLHQYFVPQNQTWSICITSHLIRQLHAVCHQLIER